jgi:hypothetical protein
MRTSKYSPEQFAKELRQAESGTPIVEICRKLQLVIPPFFGGVVSGAMPYV